MLRSLTRSFSSSARRDYLSKFTAIGRIGSDVEVQQSAKQVKYVRYPLAVNTSKDKTSWFYLTVFDERAIDFMENYINRGSLVYVEADASMQEYTVDGEKRSSLQLVQSAISPISFRRGGDDGAAE